MESRWICGFQMRPIIAVLVCSLVAAQASCARAGVVIGSGSPGATSDEAIQTEPVKELRKGVDAWPLIANPGSAAARRVNGNLTRLNLRLAKALRDCDADYLQWEKQTGNAPNPVADDWSRRVVVTMSGPRYLSLVASDETFCGGAHPEEDQMAMVFDMTTGAAVNWMALVAKSSGAKATTDSAADGSRIGALALPALIKMLMAGADADCMDAFENPQAFQLWPDAEKDVLVAQAFDLPHAVAACANELDLTMDQARQLGFNERLLDAIEEAHHRIASEPKH